MHPTFHKALDYAQKIERQFLLVDGIEQTESDTVMSINTRADNDLMRKQRLANIMHHKCRQKYHYRKDCPSTAVTSLELEQNILTQLYGQPKMMTVTVSYAVPQSSLLTILKELAKASKQTANL